MADEHYDIIIVGGGPIGIACGIEAAKKGLRYLILEKGSLVHSLYNYPANMTFFSTSEKLELDGIPFVSNSAKPTRNEALEYYRRVALSKQINIRLFEPVVTIQKIDSTFRVSTPLAQYQSAKVIIATGFYGLPFLLDVPGEDLPKVTHYYKDPHFYAFQDVLVVGASNSAVDAALETYRKGARVTMVVRQADIGERVKYWVRPDIVNRIEEGSIKVYYQSTVHEIRTKEVIVQTPDGLVTIANDWVLAMTGYQPDLEFLEKAGIQLSNDDNKQPCYHPDNYQTNVPGLYLAGVICGGMNTHSWYIENSRIHAVQIMQHITETLV